MPPHHGRPPRLAGWDYSSSAAYFVTFKVLHCRPLLGCVEDARIVLSPAGAIVLATASLLPTRFPGVVVDRLVIMPDHVHAVIGITASAPGASAYRPRCASAGEPPNSLMAHPAVVLGKVIRFWKARATFFIRRAGVPSFRWQTRYWERIIRSEVELHRIRRYIELNPSRWEEAKHLVPTVACPPHPPIRNR
jgi:REP element-mobilizing transposase RayT